MGVRAERASAHEITDDRLATRKALVKAGGGHLVTSVRGLDELLFGNTDGTEQSSDYLAINSVIDRLGAAENPRDAIEELAAHITEWFCCSGCAALWFDDSISRSAPMRGSFFSEKLTDRLVEYLNGGVVESILPGQRPALIAEREIEGPDSSGALLFVPVVSGGTPRAIILAELPSEETIDVVAELQLVSVASRFAALEIDYLKLRSSTSAGTSSASDTTTGSSNSCLSADKALSSMAHSINNSLQVVLGAVRLCLADPTDGELMDNLKNVEAEAEKVNETVGELVSLASKLCEENTSLKPARGKGIRRE